MNMDCLNAYLAPSEVESFIQLKYFSPFDIHKIPERVLEIVHEQALGFKHNPPKGHQLTLPNLLLVTCDEVELKNGIRKELIKRHT